MDPYFRVDARTTEAGAPVVRAPAPISSHAGDPRAVAGDRTHVGQTRRPTPKHRVSPPPAREPTGSGGRQQPDRNSLTLSRTLSRTPRIGPHLSASERTPETADKPKSPANRRLVMKGSGVRVPASALCSRGFSAPGALTRTAPESACSAPLATNPDRARVGVI